MKTSSTKRTTRTATLTIAVDYTDDEHGLEGRKLPRVVELAEHVEALLVQRPGVADARTVRVERKERR